MGGNFVAAEQYRGQAGIARANARIARAQGEAAKNDWYVQASRRETDSKRNLETAADNMAELKRQGTLARGAVRAQRGGSGLTEEGTGSMPEKSVLAQIEDKANSMAYAATQQDAIYRWQAATMRISGESAQYQQEMVARQYERQADMYSMFREGAQRSAPWESILTTVGTAVGAYFGGPMGAYLGAQAGSATAGVFAQGQLGSVQNMQGMSQQSQEGLGNLMAYGAKKSGISDYLNSGKESFQAWLSK